MSRYLDLAFGVCIEKPFKNLLKPFDGRHAGIAIGLGKASSLNCRELCFKSASKLCQVK